MLYGTTNTSDVVGDGLQAVLGVVGDGLQAVLGDETTHG
jgi:hypothetical protein